MFSLAFMFISGVFILYVFFSGGGGLPEELVQLARGQPLHAPVGRGEAAPQPEAVEEYRRPLPRQGLDTSRISNICLYYICQATLLVSAYSSYVRCCYDLSRIDCPCSSPRACPRCRRRLGGTPGYFLKAVMVEVVVVELGQNQLPTNQNQSTQLEGRFGYNHPGCDRPYVVLNARR